ncbi:MAG: hypothetical protein JWQ56_3809 [Pseudarthrobacter sp.]|nr:hypothetical protein [Pseudarthrobacter sp.]
MFVDFDNVYSGLKALDPAAAESFATDPGQWLRAITEADDSSGTFVRFLIRNCYLNPAVYAKYRTFWTRAGFRVIDCPSLTQQGKSSTDINLVLDAVDVLAGVTHIEEFFIASADADFTSLVQRFRAADRRTTVIVAGAVAAAYRQMADTVIQSYDFLAILSGTADAPIAGAVAFPQPATATAIAVTGPVTSAATVVRDFVTSAPGPIKGAMVAHRALSADPSLANDWDGHGKFGTWIAQIDDRIEYSPVPSPGWVWDSNRFSQDGLPSEVESLPAIEEQVTRVTDIPALSDTQYRQVFLSLAEKSRETTNRNELAKMVRDECLAANKPVARAAVNSIIQGLIYAKITLNGEVNATELASAWTKNVEGMCRVAGLQFDNDEISKLRVWTSGGLLEEP